MAALQTPFRECAEWVRASEPSYYGSSLTMAAPSSGSFLIRQLPSMAGARLHPFPCRTCRTQVRASEPLRKAEAGWDFSDPTRYPLAPQPTPTYGDRKAFNRRVLR